MSDDLPQPVTSEKDDRIVKLARRSVFQFGLRSLFLLMGACAVWVTFFNNRQQIASLKPQIEAMRPLAHELIVNDPSQIAVVRLEEKWGNENQWDVYLPPGQYQLCMATREIGRNNRLAPVKNAKPLASGKHRLVLEQEESKDGWRITVVDGEGAELLAIDESKSWYSSAHQNAVNFELSTQLPADQPVVLLRRMFDRTNGMNPADPTEGILLWIAPQTK